MKNNTQKNPNIIVDRQSFEFGVGVKILRGKYKTFNSFLTSGKAYISESGKKLLQEAWDKASDLDVVEALKIENIESRRVYFKYVGIENIFKKLNPELIDKQTIKKSTRVNKEGKLESFDDTYELYRVKGSLLGETSSWRQVSDFCIVKCSCTSTGREYLIYVQDLWRNKKPDAIEAIAWTIQVEVPNGSIEKIVRAGDCIMVKPQKNFERCVARHLTKEEYLEKLIAES